MFVERWVGSLALFMIWSGGMPAMLNVPLPPNYFGVNLLSLFSELDHFINVINIFCIAMKRSSLQKRVSKCTPRSFMKLTPSNVISVQLAC